MVGTAMVRLIVEQCGGDVHVREALFQIVKDFSLFSCIWCNRG
jgi:hypothetical protein